MSLEEFKKEILTNIEKFPANWRKGQKVFNYIDRYYQVARAVQFEERIDCFYNDNYIDDFINAAYKILTK